MLLLLSLHEAKQFWMKHLLTPAVSQCRTEVPEVSYPSPSSPGTLRIEVLFFPFRISFPQPFLIRSLPALKIQ